MSRRGGHRKRERPLRRAQQEAKRRRRNARERENGQQLERWRRDRHGLGISLARSRAPAQCHYDQSPTCPASVGSRYDVPPTATGTLLTGNSIRVRVSRDGTSGSLR